MANVSDLDALDLDLSTGDDDLATLQTFGDDDAGAYDPYADDEPVEQPEVDEWAFDPNDCPPDPSDPHAARALEVLHAAGLDPREEYDVDADDSGRPTGGRYVWVACADRCGAVAAVNTDGLGDMGSCEASEGPGKSNCEKAIDALAEAGAFAPGGWAK